MTKLPPPPHLPLLNQHVYRRKQIGTECLILLLFKTTLLNVLKCLYRYAYDIRTYGGYGI